MTEIIGIRQEKIKPFSKSTNKKQKRVNIFKKKESVFADAVEDSLDLYQKCLKENDFKLWRIKKFIKSQDERK
jgi:hypothetical protein